MRERRYDRRVQESDRANAERLRAALSRERVPPSELRAALTSVPLLDRDAWLDVVFGLEELPDDEPTLPPGCVPYLPCPVDALLHVVDHAEVRSSDVFVDVGSGVGRAAALVHLLTDATAIGIEIQPALVAEARALMRRLNVDRVSSIEGDAVARTDVLTKGTVFFLYCPFSGERLEKVLDALEGIARARPIRVCCVGLAPLSRPWLALLAEPANDVTLYRSTLTPR